MKENDARKILGLTTSASQAKIKQAYHKKLRTQHLRQIPGNTLEQRQHAYQQSVKVNAAWNTLSQTGKKRSQRPVQTNAAKTASKPSGRTQPKAQNMAEAWDSLVQLSPVSKRMTTIITLFVFVIFIILVWFFLL